ncbi:uncharacterized protein LOC113496256 [Trichoplusia ni]|uniref:Uncharacterized protein LOC113496256 n=1 Tax=Trichoplusia ni TaxID=7111 RepID=A0A7E5VSA2_TRINI|nr:uncharacterized protein LOC113496256 [Trichoplusia ni]
MYRGHTYSKLFSLGRLCFRYQCLRSASRKCDAHICIDVSNNNILRTREDHTHSPCRYRITDKVEFYLRPSGRINLRLNNFTFYKHLKARSNAHRWSCTAYGSKWKCKAHLIITDRLEVLKANIFHSHPPSMKKDMKLPLPHLGLAKKDDTESPTASLTGNPDVNKYYNSLTPFQNYLAAHSVFGSY